MGKSKKFATNKEICRGCLSVDRKLSVVSDEEYKHTFIESLTNPQQCVLLCWECVATLNRVIRFREQVRRADENLSRYLLKKRPKPIQTLSRLGFSQTDTADITTHTNVQSQDDGTNMYVESHCGDKQSISRTYEDDGNISGTKEPLFIKVEDQDCDGFGDDAEFDDDDDAKESWGDDDKAALATTPGDHFNDSDDEPLKPRVAQDITMNTTTGPALDTTMNTAFTTTTVSVQYTPRKKKKKREVKNAPAPVITMNARARRKLQQLNMAAGEVTLVTLSWEEVEAERQKSLSGEVFLRLEHRCYSCVVGFNHRAKYDQHMTKHHPSSGPEVCKVCTIRCRDAKALDAHLRRHRVRWRCSLCPAAWSRASVAVDHYSRAHSQVAATHTCTHCGHVEPTLGRLRVHLKSHGERQRCDICGKTFRDRASLKTHLFIHSGVKEYSCPECHKMFLFKKAMQVHLVTHLAPQHLYCRECDMTFKNPMSFYGHMKYNLKHIDPAKLRFECQLCDKKFAKAVRLQEHRAAIHLKITPVKCTVEGCGFACASRPVLRTHNRTVHRRARVTRNHVCHTCGKQYTTKKSLEGHLRSHTGARPFQCALCPSNFGYEAALYNHNKLVHAARKNTKKSESRPAPANSEMPAVEGAAFTQPES